VSAIDAYRAVAPPHAVDIILRLAERVRGRRFLHLSGGRLGGGSAEILRAAVPLLNDLEIETNWEVTGGDPTYFAAVQALQSAMQGVERVLTDERLDHYLELNRVTAKKLSLDADVILAHDVQPASLVASRSQGHWVWRCHFDCSHPQPAAWSFFRKIGEQFDAAIFSLPSFTARLGIPRYIVAPSIDPLSEKNRELGMGEVTSVLHELGVDRDKPLLVQVSPFTRDHHPIDAVNVYRLVKRHHDVRLVLAGTASDDRASAEVLADLREAAQHDPDIALLELPPEAQRQINALQRAATIAFQTSVREDFGIGAAEAMWKGKPVIGAAVGGLTQLIVHDVTGYTVHSVEGAAFRIRHLFNNPELIPRMGAAGREHVRRGFLITRHLIDYLALMIDLPSPRTSAAPDATPPPPA
jgi:trehalose synthase